MRDSFRRLASAPKAEYNLGVTEEITTRRENISFLFVSYFVLVAAGVVGLRFDPPSSITVRWVIISLLALLAVVQLRRPRRTGPAWQIHVYLGVHGCLVETLMFLQPGWTMYPVLYMTAITWALLVLPLRQGIGWIVVYSTATAISFAVGISLAEGLIALLLYSVLYAFIGTFARALSRADASRQESQALLADLQEAHRRLQDYAMRVEEMAAVEERNRLAREMHDTLGHRLTVASVQLEAAQRLAATDWERTASLVATVREQVREALGELRDTVAALRTPIEADLHLRSALRRLIAHFEEATDLTVHRILPDEMPSIPDTHRLALFRAAQELLTNIQKHAEARQAWLVLSIGGGSVTLLISDDGKGIMMSNGSTGFGLQGLRERAAHLGGELYIEPRPGGGTQFSIRLPLPRERHDA